VELVKNMKIIAFNVNGIRAILKKTLAEDFKKLDADVFVIEETKFSEEKHEDFPFKPEGYEVYWTVSKEKKGYSGVAILTRVKPLGVTYGLKDGKYDEEGRIITMEFPSFYLIGCYTPNSGEELKRLGFRMAFEDDLKAYMRQLDQKKPVILTGDLNVAHEEIDIKNPQANIHNAGFTREERDKFTALLASGFKDTFRTLYPTQVKYSWWSYRFNARATDAGWRIDYFVVSERLMKDVEDSQIHNEITGSDHCPVELDLHD
jgi:exodeoxyribonuclease-3